MADDPTDCREPHENVDIRWEPYVQALDVGARRVQCVRPIRQYARCAIAHTPYKGLPLCTCECVCVVRACMHALNVSCRMVLAIGMGDAGEEGSQQRQTFAACLISDLADAAGARARVG